MANELADVVEKVGASVVRVEGGRRNASGIAWAKNLVLTVDHAIDREEDVTVGVEGQTFKAKVKGRDRTTDLALLEIEGELWVPQFGDGSALRVGHSVLQLARPGETVRASAGIVSALGKKPWRSWRGGEIDRFLESDARHQPGFSGGPLVGSDGKIVGLTTSGLLRHQPVTIPTATLKRVADQLAQHGKVRQSWLGLSMQPLQLPDDVRAATGEEIGLLVVAVEKGGPAEAAGLVYGDTVLHLGDASVKTLDDLYAYLRADHAGQKVPVKLFRHGKVQTLDVTLGAKP